MEMPDLKEQARSQIDNLNGEALGVVQIMISDKGHVAVCVGGITDAIVNVLATTMKDSHQIKDLFESAYCRATEMGFKKS